MPQMQRILSNVTLHRIGKIISTMEKNVLKFKIYSLNMAFKKTLAKASRTKMRDSKVKRIQWDKWVNEAEDMMKGGQ